MTTTVLRPTGATFQPVGSTGTLYITGGPPQWGDQDLTTYSDHETDAASALTAPGWAEMPAMPALTDVTRFAIYATVENLDVDDLQVQGGLITEFDPMIVVAFQAPFGPGPFTGTFLELTEVTIPTAQQAVDYIVASTTVDPYYSAVEGASSLVPGPPTSLLYVYETWVEIDTAGSEYPRYTRMFPRHDGRNMSSAPRIIGGIR